MYWDLDRDEFVMFIFCSCVYLIVYIPECPRQWWANLDQAPEDLDKTIFRDLSPTPKPWVLEVLSTQAHFFGAALEKIAEKSR